MADDRGGARDYPAWKPKPASWTKLFGTFLVAVDPIKLLVAAGGILFTALGWWLISVIFFASWTEPELEHFRDKAKKESSLTDEVQREEWAKREYSQALGTWALMYELAGPTERSSTKFAEYYQTRYPAGTVRNDRYARGFGGKYRAMPWDENRGPNPVVMTRTVASGSGPERREVFGQFATYQLPNLVEPLLKFLGPIYYLLDTRATFWVYVYLILLILWFLIVWGFFGGILTRMVVLQLSGKEGGGVFEAYRFVRRRYINYLLSPLVPLGVIAFLALCCFLFGIIHWCPILGDFWDGIFWILPLIAGLLMTGLLLGMIGYPMMYTTLSTEGSDTFDAMSRSYNYVYESPWHYLWYSLVAIAYGALLVLFVVVFGSLAAYLAKWGVKQFPAWETDRSPEYLFIYAPESLGWRQLLTEGSPIAINEYGEAKDQNEYNRWEGEYRWWNHVGAVLASFWVTLLFMMVIGFSYSYFWTAATQIYLLMRQRVDETEMDEVYVEEELPEMPLGGSPAYTPPSTPPAPTPTPTGPVSVPVDAPTLRQPETPAPAPAPTPPPTTPPGETPPSETSGDGKPPGT